MGALALAVLTACAVASYGSSNQSSWSSPPGSPLSGAATPTINMVQGTFPQSLDPGKDYTTQGEETNWIVYTGLVTYAHKSGATGGQLIPGLATALPKISDGGKTYTATLRTG